MMAAVPAQSTFQQASSIVAQFVGLAILAATLAAVAALVYRWYVREMIPTGLALLVGLSGVAVYLNTMTALGDVIGGDVAPTELEVALFNIVAFLFGVGGALVGSQVGDRFTTDVVVGRSTRKIDTEVSRLVQTVGRVITVELPEEIDDAVGYDPISPHTREQLAGKEFVFPRNLTVEELRTRLVARLKTDYAVGYVDLDLTEDGAVTHLAVGSRAAGIGPTLPPATNAVAVRADPAFSASSGDLVQLWETDPMRRVLTAELRGVADDVVTLAINAADTPKVDPTQTYRLVTLPVEDRPEREFASLLRAAEETFSAVTVKAGSPLHGMPVGALSPLVVAITPEDESPEVLPGSTRVLEPGELVSAIATPDALRRLELAAEPLDPALVRERATSQRSGPVAAGQNEATPSRAPEPQATDTRAADERPRESTDATPPQERDTAHESTANDDPESTSKGDADIPGNADPTSFEDLKADFESGEADWDDERDDRQADPASTLDADASEPDSPEESEDDLSTLEFDAEEDEDLSDLELDDDDSEFSFGDDPLFDGDDEESDVDDEADGEDERETDERETDESEDDRDADGGDANESNEDGGDTDESGEDGSGGDGDGENDDETVNDDETTNDDDDGGSGGTTSFQQLKEEFESGEADWEDDISDSPGGDMRLDE